MAAEEPFHAAFANVPDPERRRLRELAGPRAFARGETLLVQGDPPGAAHVVMAGRVKVSVAGAGGREVIVGVHGPGTLLAETAALFDLPRSATVRCLEPTRTLALPGDALRAAAQRSAVLAFALLELAARRLQSADEQRAEFAGYDVLGRVSRRLVALADEHGRPVADGVELGVRLSQDDLASWTAASREAVNRSLQTLRGLGWVRSEGQRVVIVDVDSLRAYGGG